MPHQLTPDEVATIEEFVTGGEYRHVPTGTFAILAQWLGKVFASASTWRRLVKVHRWRRTKPRVHPAKSKVGIRAMTFNENWQIDTAVVRLLDGSRAYLHAVIDNDSLRILSWKVSPTFNPIATADILLTASKGVSDCKGGDIEVNFETSWKKAQKERIETNRKRICRACEPLVEIASGVPKPLFPRLSWLRRRANCSEIAMLAEKTSVFVACPRLTVRTEPQFSLSRGSSCTKI